MNGPSMYVNPEQLKQTFQSLDSAVIRDKLRSGGLTAEARGIAQAELAARGEVFEEGESPPAATVAAAPDPQPSSDGRTLAIAVRVLWVLYLVFLAACATAVVFDPPRGTQPHGAYDGMVGLIASAAAGFPWTYVGVFLLGAMPFMGQVLEALGEFGTVVLCWVGAALNLYLFRRYFNRSR